MKSIKSNAVKSAIFMAAVLFAAPAFFSCSTSLSDDDDCDESVTQSETKLTGQAPVVKETVALEDVSVAAPEEVVEEMDDEVVCDDEEDDDDDDIEVVIELSTDNGGNGCTIRKGHGGKHHKHHNNVEVYDPFFGPENGPRF